ncbi:dienelactone hydrolase [Pseudonocardia hierapolitana]|uniref:Dienelactone hydrolase n=1 Tax=Pseudonocardia hierapolitana TaxID=1128676 RepID=A0A561T0B6_9PSEU|nr:dienelactone hydrolase family protein [Pseudonocardia hierapolitana]TWF80554.1 dienelactone hydrolase [Pseudonocardia hierapolitana]
MAEVLFFHHVQGLTPGVVAFADRLRAAGHAVHSPDLYGGRVFPTIEEGLAFTDGPGAPDLAGLAAAAAADLPAELVYAGISAGAVLAQRLAQTRAGAAGAVLMESCLPVSGEWAIGPWPEGVPVQIHGMVDDGYFAGEGDIDAARELVEAAGPTAELFLYPGDEHLFEDSSLASYDAAATELLTARIVDFLGRVPGA